MSALNVVTESICNVEPASALMLATFSRFCWFTSRRDSRRVSPCSTVALPADGRKRMPPPLLVCSVRSLVSAALINCALLMSLLAMFRVSARVGAPWITATLLMVWPLKSAPVSRRARVMLVLAP